MLLSRGRGLSSDLKDAGGRDSGFDLAGLEVHLDLVNKGAIEIARQHVVAVDGDEGLTVVVEQVGADEVVRLVLEFDALRSGKRDDLQAAFGDFPQRGFDLAGDRLDVLLVLVAGQREIVEQKLLRIVLDDDLVGGRRGASRDLCARSEASRDRPRLRVYEY